MLKLLNYSFFFRGLFVYTSNMQSSVFVVNFCRVGLASFEVTKWTTTSYIIIVSVSHLFLHIYKNHYGYQVSYNHYIIYFIQKLSMHIKYINMIDTLMFVSNLIIKIFTRCSVLLHHSNQIN